MTLLEAGVKRAAFAGQLWQMANRDGPCGDYLPHTLEKREVKPAVTTVSRYMKRRMAPLGADALVIARADVIVDDATASGRTGTKDAVCLVGTRGHDRQP